MAKKDETYTQCTLVKKLDNDDESRHTAWIPSEYAQIGQAVQIERIPGKWEDGYVVAEVFGTRTAEQIEAHERDYLKQRQASDI